MRQHQIECYGAYCKKYNQDCVGIESRLESGSRLLPLVASDEGPDDWRDGEIEAYGEEHGEHEDVVHEACRREFECRVMPYHEGVGEVENKVADLADHDRRPEMYKVSVMVGCCSLHDAVCGMRFGLLLAM